MHKIKQLGIKGPLFNLLESYLPNRKMRVVLDGAKSRWFNIFTGVPQGSILGPLLFLIYVNDLVDNLECEISLYADDAVLISHYLDEIEASFEKLNRDLSRLSAWADKWHMAFNPGKTKYMVVSTRNRENPYIFINGTTLLAKKLCFGVNH